MNKETEILNKVLFIGPDLNGLGGMSSVLKSYKDNFRPFHYLPSNSRKGFIPGLLNLSILFLRLPIERLKGRKILHIHFAGGKSFLRKSSILSLGKFLGYKCIMHCHCNIIESSKKQGPSKVKKILGKADQTIVLASKYLNYVINVLGISKCNIVNNPVSQVENIVSSNSDITTFLFLGLLNENKGIYDLIEACQIVKNNSYDFKLIVGGVGDDKKCMDLIKSYGLESSIVLRGWISGEAHKAAFEQCDVLVLPSYSEGMPMSILEALTFGKPVIATDVGAIPDLLSENNGIIVKPGNPKKLASAMETYISDKYKLEQDSKNALNSSYRFSFDKVLESLNKIYATLL